NRSDGTFGRTAEPQVLQPAAGRSEGRLQCVEGDRIQPRLTQLGAPDRRLGTVRECTLGDPGAHWSVRGTVRVPGTPRPGPPTCSTCGSRTCGRGTVTGSALRSAGDAPRRSRDPCLHD